MVTINKVYTRGGDKGETSLVGGRRLPKFHARIESYGTTDELNAILGVIRALAMQETQSEEWKRFVEIILAIQQKLFDLGSELATHPEDNYQGQILMGASDVDWLEKMIDAMNKELKPLGSFVLPGATLLDAHLHQARTVCRRAERQVIRCAEAEAINPQLRKFLNRLSDLFFVMARWVCKTSQTPEILWHPRSSLPVWSS